MSTIEYNSSKNKNRHRIFVSMFIMADVIMCESLQHTFTYILLVN